MHNGKLSLLHPISSRSGSMISVLIIAGVTTDVTEEVPSRSLLTFYYYSSYGVGVAFLEILFIGDLRGCLVYLLHFFKRFSFFYYYVPGISHAVISQLLD